jgi:hypothetical protein
MVERRGRAARERDESMMGAGFARRDRAIDRDPPSGGLQGLTGHVGFFKPRSREDHRSVKPRIAA